MLDLKISEYFEKHLVNDLATNRLTLHDSAGTLDKEKIMTKITTYAYSETQLNIQPDALIGSIGLAKLLPLARFILNNTDLHDHKVRENLPAGVSDDDVAEFLHPLIASRDQ
jgi:hypothetical protein